MKIKNINLTKYFIKLKIEVDKKNVGGMLR